MAKCRVSAWCTDNRAPCGGAFLAEGDGIFQQALGGVIIAFMGPGLPMRYGIFYLPSLSAADRSDGSGRLRAIVEQAAYGEELGFDSVWLAEHHFHSFGGILASPPVIGAGIAQRTAKIRIGTAVTLLPCHNPLRTAEDA